MKWSRYAFSRNIDGTIRDSRKEDVAALCLWVPGKVTIPLNATTKHLKRHGYTVWYHFESHQEGTLKSVVALPSFSLPYPYVIYSGD
jgi:hypothetical protein